MVQHFSVWSAHIEKSSQKRWSKIKNLCPDILPEWALAYDWSVCPLVEQQLIFKFEF